MIIVIFNQYQLAKKQDILNLAASNSKKGMCILLKFRSGAYYTRVYYAQITTMFP